MFVKLKEILLVYLENSSKDFVLWHGCKLTQGSDSPVEM